MRYLDSDIINKNKHFSEDLKQVQVNTYYYKRYKSENYILYFIMFMCFIIISIALIKKKMPFFDDLSYSIIVATIMGLSLLYIVYCINILIHKDAVNYDEHDYKFDYKSVPDISNNDNECLKFEPISIKTEINY